MTLDLTPSEDLQPILDVARAMLDARYPLARLRSNSLQDDMQPLADFGAFSLALPEAMGGTGLSVIEEAALHAALGRHLLSPSAVASAVAARVVLEHGYIDRAKAIASGAERVCAGVRVDSAWLLFDAEAAGSALICGDGPPHLAPFSHEAMAQVTSMGLGRALGRLPAAEDGLVANEATERIADLLIAAQLLGIAAAALDLSVSYAATREQFGRPIGSFQAIKHHLANMWVSVQMLGAQLDMASAALKSRSPEAAFQIATLAHLAPRIALENARLGIQIHGGIGFSAEADAHLYVKHAHVLRQMLGASDMLAQSAPLSPLCHATD